VSSGTSGEKSFVKHSSTYTGSRLKAEYRRRITEKAIRHLWSDGSDGNRRTGGQRRPEYKTIQFPGRKQIQQKRGALMRGNLFRVKSHSRKQDL